MIISYPKWMAEQLMKIFTRENQDYKRLEKVRKKPLPRLRYKKLYTQIWNQVYFPLGAFNKKLFDKSRVLSIPFEYYWEPTEEQAKVIDEIDVNDFRTWLIEMKTWRGKWHIILQLANLFQEKVLIACHSRSNMQDTINKFKEFSNYIPWQYHSTKKEIKEITITTHKSLVQKTKEFAGKFGILIVDECDYNLTEDMLKALATIDVNWCFGMSWTPTTKELDIESMELIRWPHIKVEGQEDNWYNLIPDILRLDYRSNSIYSFWTSFSELKEALLEDNVRTATQIFRIKKIMSENWKFGLLLLERKSQECTKYYNLLHYEIPCIIINGDTKIDDDEAGIQRLKEQGHGLIIWTIWKVWRWKDIPMIDVVFLFFPNRYQNSTVQAVWRGLRNAPWKTRCLLVDWIDNPILKRQSYDRLKTYCKEYTDSCKIRTLSIRPINENL